MANTLPIELRRELVPVLRSGNFAGPGYAGGWGSESVITHAAINNGQPIQVAVMGTLHNTADHMNGGELPGDLGSATSALVFINALEHGKTGSAVVSGVSLANKLGENFASNDSCMRSVA